MSEGIGDQNHDTDTDVTGLDDPTALNPAAAAAIIREAGARARRELVISRPVLLATWGLALLVGYGAMWFSVRRQQPYHGPSAQTVALVLVLLLAALLVTVAAAERPGADVGGRSATRRAVFALCLVAAFVSLGVEKIMLFEIGADSSVLGVVGSANPLLATGLAFVASAAVDLRTGWSRFVLGAWLLAVACAGMGQGPVTCLAISALAGGGGILLMAAVQPRFVSP